MDVKQTWDRIAGTIQNVIDAGWVHITRYDAARDEVVIVGTSPFRIPTLNQLLVVTDTLISPLSPFHRNHHPWVNFVTRQVYLEGQGVRTTIDNFLSGILAPELIAVLAQYGMLHSVQAFPLKNSHKEVTGALIAYGGTDTRFDQLPQFEDLIVLSREVIHAPHSQSIVHAIQEASWNWNTYSVQRRTEHADVLDTVVQSRLSASTWRLNELLNRDDLSPSLQSAIREVRDILSNLAADEIYELSQSLYPSLLRIGLIPGLSGLINQNPWAAQIELTTDEETRDWDHPLHNHIPGSIRLGAWAMVGLHLEALTYGPRPAAIRIHVAIGQGRLWLQIQGDLHNPLRSPSHRAEIDEYALLLAGTTYWWDCGASLMVILPLSFDSAVKISDSTAPEIRPAFPKMHP